MIRTILFDLDDTLYPRHAGVMDQIRDLMLHYLQTRFDLSPEQADLLRRQYFATYGTTMRGLQINHHIDADEFLHYVHDIPLHRFLQPNPELEAVLAAIPQDKVVFTNASREHAGRVLSILGIRQHFSHIVDVRDMNYESKPQLSAYRRICEILDLQPEECMLVEDNIRNLQPAKALGMITVLVASGQDAAADAADYVIARIEDIEQVLARTELPDPRPDRQACQTS
ncbi:MAG: pyrimidine 5'-nucleotidase [Anaerolineae bacterium]|jgi:putative hydrolase of the HAD superfamily